MMTDFEKFAVSQGIGTSKIDGFAKYNMKNGIIEPYILEERTLNCAPMSVFSRLMYDKIIFLGTMINDDVANIITAQLLYLNSVTDKDEDIKLFINSGGGSIDCGMAILDIMDFVDPDVSTYCIGTCASMAAVLLSSGAQGKRFSLPHSKTMIHQPMSSVGPYTQESDFKIAYDELKKAKDMLYQILSKNTGKSIEEIERDADRDHWLTAEECLPGVYGPLGLIDKIVTRK